MAGRVGAWLRMPDLRVWRRRLIVFGVLGLALLAGYMFWLRDSSLVAVENVKVEGVTANEPEITEALKKVGLEQTTLHVDDDELAEAVSGFPTVASIRADASIPNDLTIVVTERRAVAIAKVDGKRVAVSGDGFVLVGIEPEEKLPSLEGGGAEGAKLGPEAAAQAEILGAAPEPLRESLVSAAWDDEKDSVIVELEGAPELRFGDGGEAEEKWRAVATVLASPDVNAPDFLDVSVPERTVSG